MTYDQAVKTFKQNHVNLYLDKVDYWTAFEAWTAYIDGLCKDGEITNKQFESWKTPFEYGKNLKPSYRQLQWAYDTR